MIASVISDHVNMTSPPECFLSGLLHDIGRIIFYKMDHNLFFKIPTTDDMLERNGSSSVVPMPIRGPGSPRQPVCP